MRRLEELIKRDWSYEAYKKALIGNSAEECKKIDDKWERELREFYLLESILTGVIELFSSISELKEMYKELKDN